MGFSTQEERVVDAETGGAKGSKLERYDLIPIEPLAEVARLYGAGAKKYDERNWENGYKWSLSFAALCRHLWKFWSGESFDEETGRHHLACVVFHAFALMYFETHHPEGDTRPCSTLKKSASPSLKQPRTLRRLLTGFLSAVRS